MCLLAILWESEMWHKIYLEDCVTSMLHLTCVSVGICLKAMLWENKSWNYIFGRLCHFYASVDNLVALSTFTSFCLSTRICSDTCCLMNNPGGYQKTLCHDHSWMWCENLALFNMLRSGESVQYVKTGSETNRLFALRCNISCPHATSRVMFIYSGSLFGEQSKRILTKS